MEVTKEVVGDIQYKHPRARESEAARKKDLRNISPSAGLTLSSDVVLEAIRSFPRGSAGGPSGLKPQHLKDALAPGWGDEVIRHLTDLANQMSQGIMAQEARPYFMGATLTALQKPDGAGFRPVAAGETIRRMAAKSLWATCKQEVRESLEPVQLGVGTSMGA